jgi:hypothetical protein
LGRARDNHYAAWPEMTRATLLASSTHPVNGTRLQHLTAGGTDLMDGAGLLNELNVVGIALSSNYRAPRTASAPQGSMQRPIHLPQTSQVIGQQRITVCRLIETVGYASQSLGILLALDAGPPTMTIAPEMLWMQILICTYFGLLPDRRQRFAHRIPGTHRGRCATLQCPRAKPTRPGCILEQPIPRVLSWEFPGKYIRPRRNRSEVVTDADRIATLRS